MLTHDQLPEDHELFDYDKHVSVVSKFIKQLEDAFFELNNTLGNRITRKDGVRMDFDVIHIRSLINSKRDGYYLTYAPTGMMRDAEPHLIAAVSDEQLWFRSEESYFSAEELLKTHAKVAKLAAEHLAPLRKLISELKESLDEDPSED